MKRLTLGFVMASLWFTGSMAVASYRCQIATQQPARLENIDWDGRPGLISFSFRDQQAWWRVQQIGLPGHPEYLFDLKVGDRIVFDMSQKKGLADYVFSWRSLEEGTRDIISIACRKAPRHVSPKSN